MEIYWTPLPQQSFIDATRLVWILHILIGLWLVLWGDKSRALMARVWLNLSAFLALIGVYTCFNLFYKLSQREAPVPSQINTYISWYILLVNQMWNKLGEGLRRIWMVLSYGWSKRTTSGVLLNHNNTNVLIICSNNKLLKEEKCIPPRIYICGQ